ncbi:MAG: excinuclease ABC subunit UvrB [Candidatus Riflebacteria bacterium]|nr:excinuclease ABC subunit UvrB [Candidatus Riflebacteria bacterium]
MQSPELFKLHSPYSLSGDQPQAVENLTEWLREGAKNTTLLGVTGSGKTFSMANVIQRLQRPVLVITHNKTLSAQLYSEFKDFFPDNAVEYFVSYYDYYQPEAYVPSTDSYIEKDSAINDQIDRFRHGATTSLFTRRDIIVVASISCIFGLGSPADYADLRITIKKGSMHGKNKLIRQLVDIQYSRNDMDFSRSRFRVRGEVIDIFPAASEEGIRVRFFGDEAEKIERFDPLTGELLESLKQVEIFPAQHFVTTEEKRELALQNIEFEMKERVKYFESEGKLIEAQRIYERTRYDLEMMRETGFCKGIENYSRHFSGRNPGEPPDTLVSYLPKDCLIILDESHMTVPQLKGMYRADRNRKQTLIDYGFRLPSALDNRCLTFEEFLSKDLPIMYVSATPGRYELEVSENKVAEQLIRPTGLLDPEIEVVKTEGQIDYLIEQINERIERDERVLITTMTKKMARELATYLADLNIPSGYLHDEIDTLERVEILHDLRTGEIKVLVGINLLREGLDLPEVSLVAILDADKQGFLRSEWSLMQTSGRAARNASGKVILFGDKITPAMEYCINETARRRKIQEAHNKKYGIVPKTIKKAIAETFAPTWEHPEHASNPAHTKLTRKVANEQLAEILTKLKQEMESAAAKLEFEKAAAIRDEIITIQSEHLESDILGNISQALKKGKAKGSARKRALKKQ